MHSNDSLRRNWTLLRAEEQRNPISKGRSPNPSPCLCAPLPAKDTEGSLQLPTGSHPAAFLWFSCLHGFSAGPQYHKNSNGELCPSGIPKDEVSWSDNQLFPTPWTALSRAAQVRRRFGHLPPMDTSAWQDPQGECQSCS